ncbi:NDP-hexose 2,3-dehydratase family protein [Streptomonospora sediminis]
MQRRPQGLLRKPDAILPRRIARSAATVDDGALPLAEIWNWIAEQNRAQRHDAARIPFAMLRNWSFDPDSGNLGHDSGRFFTVEGLEVFTDYGPVPHWSQPIIHQPEIGILGFLAKDIGGVLHFLVQAKSEPGNHNGVQLSPTVQATKSNYTRVHKGRDVPCLEYFRNAPPENILADVLQSEQGSWFYRKRNRNMIVEITDDIAPSDHFCWLTLGQLHELLKVDNLVNMDARTVLSCMPAGLADGGPGPDGGLPAAIARSAQSTAGSLHTSTAVMSWITEHQTRHFVQTTPIQLKTVKEWHITDDVIAHDRGLFFGIIAVEVTTNSREVGGWTQPLVRPNSIGTIALLVRRIDGVLHALVNARMEPGYLDVVELAPTVQCSPENYTDADRPPYLDTVLNIRPEQVLYDVELSEEGGRFYRARNRYQIIEVGSEIPDCSADGGLAGYRWLTLYQLTDLLRHSHYINVQARSLIACLRGLQ